MAIHVRCTTRADGDFNPDVVPATELARRQRAVVDLPWTWLDEVHGTDVAVVGHPGDQAGQVADAAVTAEPGAVLSVFGGDCAPVALWDQAAGVIGIAHAGWRGLEAGVLPAAVQAMRALGADTISAEIGPHIHPGAYEFGADDLERLVTRFDPSVRARTRSGAAAFDVARAVTIDLARCGVEVRSSGACTATEAGRYWSHRARGERGRQAMAIWRDA